MWDDGVKTGVAGTSPELVILVVLRRTCSLSSLITCVPPKPPLPSWVEYSHSLSRCKPQCKHICQWPPYPSICFGDDQMIRPVIAVTVPILQNFVCHAGTHTRGTFAVQLLLRVTSQSWWPSVPVALCRLYKMYCRLLCRQWFKSVDTSAVLKWSWCRQSGGAGTGSWALAVLLIPSQRAKVVSTTWQCGCTMETMMVDAVALTFS